MANYISKSKESKPTQPVLEAIVKATGVDAKWLLTGEGFPFPPASPSGQQQQQVEGGAFQAQGLLVEQIRDIKIEETSGSRPAVNERIGGVGQSGQTQEELNKEISHLRDMLAEKEARISDLQRQLDDNRGDIAFLRSMLNEERSRRSS